jgi:uncharacterized protein (TIRG00374 family)
VTAPRTAWPPDLRVFSSGSNEPRSRRPTDVLLLVVSVPALVLLTVFSTDPATAGADLARFVQSLPGLLGWFWEICYDLLLIWTLALVIMAAVAKGRITLVRDQVLAGVVGLAGTIMLSRLATGSWPSLIDGWWGSAPGADFPAVRVAVATAVSATTSPHLSRPLRRLGRVVITVGAMASVALGSAFPGGILAGLMVGAAVAAAVHLLFGSPGGRPTGRQVTSALRDLGIETTEVHFPELEPRGVALAQATGADGRRLLVKIYGRDAWDGQLLSSTWSFLWYRDEIPNIHLSRVQQVEHEAFVTLLAERLGVPVLPVVAAGLARGRDAVLVLELRGRSLSSALDETGEEVLRPLWEAVTKLHQGGIAHGRLEMDRLVVLGDGSVALADFAAASLTPTPTQVLADRAQLVVTTALAFGIDRAVAAASDALGGGGLTEVLPFLQGPALTRATRRRVDDGTWDMTDLRQTAAQAVGATPPKLEPLRRVTLGTAVQAALFFVAAYFLVTGIAGLGLSSIVDELREAEWGFLLAALLVSPLIQAAQAFGTLGASVRPLQYGPVLLLQFAIQFLGLAVPSSAARLAMNIRFFQQVGVPPTAAVSVAAIDSVAGFVVQVLLLLLIAVSGLATLDLSLEGLESSGLARLMLLGLIMVLIAALVGVAMRRTRRMIRARLSELRGSFRTLQSPSRLAQLFGGNLTAQLIAAGVLGVCLRSFGHHVPFAELLLINTLVSLLAGVLPVPGGIGVCEAATTAGLIAVGVPDGTALATALSYRVITFYLPPIWGWFAVRRLQREGYL